VRILKTYFKIVHARSRRQAFFKTPEFGRLLDEARDALTRRPRGEPPGVIQREARAALARYSTPGFRDQDPLLRHAHPDPLSVWEPQLNADAGDFLGVYRSTWENVHKKVKATAGHAEGTAHYYAVVGWSLPIEIADQLAHVVKANPRGGTWADLAARTEFRAAEELARLAREKLLSNFLGMTRLAIKASCPAPVHTVSDVFRRARVSRAALASAATAPADAEGGGGNGGDVDSAATTLDDLIIRTTDEEDEGNMRDAVVFYAGAACTQSAGPGVLVMTAADPAKPIVWFHGPRVTGVVGGGPWNQHATAHAFPTFGASLKPATKAFANTMQARAARTLFLYICLVHSSSFYFSIFTDRGLQGRVGRGETGKRRPRLDAAPLLRPARLFEQKLHQFRMPNHRVARGVRNSVLRYARLDVLDRVRLERAQRARARRLVQVDRALRVRRTQLQKPILHQRERRRQPHVDRVQRLEAREGVRL